MKDGETDIPVSTPTEGTYTFTMPAANVAVSATFKAINYTITLAPAENGTLTADKQTAHYGDLVTLTVTPAEGYELDQLSVLNGETAIDVTTPAEGTYTFTMPAADVVVSATFKAINYTVTLVPAENGTLTADKQTAHYGDLVTLTITPADGYAFDQLTVKDGETDIPVTTPTEGTYTFAMPAANVTVSVSFYKKAEYSISITLAGNGSVIAGKASTYAGDTVALTVTPAVGYKLDQLRVMAGETEVDVVAKEDGQYFVMPAANVVVSAVFKVTTGNDVPEIDAPYTAPRKVVRDGQVFIIYGDKTYTITGQYLPTPSKGGAQ